MRRLPTALLGVVLIASLGGSCTTGHFPTFHDYPAAETFPLGEGDGGPDVMALAARFYAPALEPDDLRAIQADLTPLLERHPRDAILHEVAAHLATLRAEDDAAWTHWMRAAADTASPFIRIYLDRALRQDLTGRQTTAAVDLLEAITTSHPNASVRVDAARRLIGLYEARARFVDADRLGDTLGFVEQWKIIGAFDNDQGRGLVAIHPPEVDIDLDAEVRGLLLPVRWRDVTARDRAGIVRLDDQVSPARWALAYLLTHVHSETPREVQLRLTTGDDVRVWLNGVQVIDRTRVSGGATDNIVAPVHLARGWNRLLVKSAHDDDGPWFLGARITDRDGRALASLREDAALHPHPVVETPELPEQISNPPALADVEPPLRRLLLTHHEAARNGLERETLAHARALLEHASEHPLVLHDAALTHWRSDELGRAMDLLNQGVRRFPTLAGLRWRRGAFYRERQRYDRATDDLRAAVERTKGARRARMELAATFEARGFRENECATLEDVLERWPSSGWALRALGDCEQDRGYLDRAWERYRRADALEPGHAWNLQRLATLARWRSDFTEALRFAERLRALAPWDVGHVVTLADIQRYAGQRDAARATYRAAIERDPAWALPHHRLGLMAHEDRDDARALEAWTAALARDPDNGDLAERVDFLRGGDDADRRSMPTDADIQRALTMEVDVHPGAHSVLLLDDEVTTVQRDGSSMRRITQVHFAVTTDGRDALIRTSVPRQARILEAYAVSREGAHQEASSIRGGTIRFRGLGVGSRVVLQYVYHAPPPAFLPNHFVSSWLFQGVHRQLVHARWLVEVPAGRALAMNVQGPVEHVFRREGERDVHVFTAANVPPLVPERFMPPARDLLATVTLSTLTDWDEYVDWERALLREVFQSNAALRALADRLTEGASTPRERLDRIYHFVAREIRYQQDYESTIAGVRPHSCPVVIERGYGDCKDKAVLMILLARELGIDLRFAILRTTPAGRVLRNVPNQQFNHAIVYVPRQDGVEAGFFMDPTTDGLDMGNLRPDDQGATALVLDPNHGDQWELIDIPYQSPEQTYLRCDVDVRVASDRRAMAEARCTMRGANAAGLRRTVRNTESARQYYQGFADLMFAGASVRSAETEHADDIWRPVELSLSIDASPALRTRGRAHHMPVPGDFPFTAGTRLESRRTPLRLGPPDSQRWQITYEAPPGARIVRAPGSFEVEHACFRVSRETRIRGRRATVRVDYERSCTEVSPADYAELRRLAQRAANQLDADVVFDL